MTRFIDLLKTAQERPFYAVSDSLEKRGDIHDHSQVQKFLSPVKTRQILAAATTEKWPGHVEFGSMKYFWLCGIGGMISCGATHAAIVPLDLVKCRMQVDHDKYPSIIKGFQVTKNEEGLKGLSKGWLPTLLGYSAQGFFKFGLYEVFKLKYSELVGPSNAFYYRTWVYLAASASAEFFADIALSPMEAMKVRMQTNPGYPARLMPAISLLFKQEGVNGFYKSLVPLWMRQIPYTMMKFSSFERTVEAIYTHVVRKPRDQVRKSEQLLVTATAGYIAGVFCAIVSHPADTIVSKMNQAKGMSAVQVCQALGFKGIWKGLGARIIMIGTLTSLQWFIYDGVKVVLNLPRPPPPTPPANSKK